MANEQEEKGIDLVIKNTNKKSFISYRYTRFVSLIKLVFLVILLLSTNKNLI